MKYILLLAMLLVVPSARADVSDSGNLSIGGNGIIFGSMTVIGPVAASSVTLSSTGAGPYDLTTSTGIHVLAGVIKLEPGAYVQWGDMSKSTTASSGGGSTMGIATGPTTGIGSTSLPHETTVYFDSTYFTATDSSTIGSTVISLKISTTGAAIYNAVVPFNSTTCPSGWIVANGSNGTPDLRGMFVRGAGTNGTYTTSQGATPAATFGTEYVDTIQAHTHSMGMAFYNESFTPGGTGDGVTSGGNTGSTGGNETRPINYALTYCVSVTTAIGFTGATGATGATGPAGTNGGSFIFSTATLSTDGTGFASITKLNLNSTQFSYSTNTAGAAFLSLVTGGSYPPVNTSQQFFANGLFTYTLPTSPSTPRQIEVDCWGQGGGGGASATNAGTAGSSTTWITAGSTIAANGGSGGPANATGAGSGSGIGGTGGTGGFGVWASSSVVRTPGGNGCQSLYGTNYNATSCGGFSAHGPGAPSTGNGIGNPVAVNALPNSGGGGAGGGGASVNVGSGGGGGESFHLVINSPLSKYYGNVGYLGGTGGAAGSIAGSNGGSGGCVVTEHY